MKTTLNFLMFLTLVFTSCSNDDELKPLAIGDFHEGGVIFYLDGTGQHGLVCAVSDQSTGAIWGCWGIEIIGADGTVIGTGSQNTIDIEARCTTVGTAADLCANLTLNSYSDWFLPSKDELNEMFLNRATINATSTANGGTGLAQATFYWSSTEFDNFDAWFAIGSGSGEQGHVSKAQPVLHVRSVRAF